MEKLLDQDRWQDEVTWPALDSSPDELIIPRGVLESVETGDALLAEGTRVGGFCICGLLGEGAMGQVYLAQDTTLGRRIALKLIKRSVMQGDAKERFLAEARATASFNHPHIVTLHAVGEHDGRPYLALEYLDGESLRARLAAGPLPVQDALRCARAIAEAVAEAHRHGLVHADLKPENIVIPRDGRLRVVDFGLARLAGREVPTVSGTPAYMAPERWRGAPPTGAIDVWAIGVMLHELVTGRRPAGDATLLRLPFSGAGLDLSGLPAAPWAAVVRDCLARDPGARPTAEELVRRIARLTERPTAADGDARCPFPGLAAFSPDRAADYFGRRARLDALVDQLRTRALIPVVGPQGAGKSSFIHAALLPRLEDTGRWVAVAVQPGAAPLARLAAALALPGRPAAAIAASLRRDPDGLARALRAVAEHHRARVLLFVDQLEEALAGPDEDARALCDRLGRAADAAAPWRIVLALRDDALDRLASSPAMRPHLGAVTRLGPLSAADLRAAVAGPLANAGYEADAPDLIARIADDALGQPACLPLLQLACRALWERRDPGARRIVAAEYEAMGGAAGALAELARRFLAELTADEVRIARAILVALFDAGGTCRPRPRAELLDVMPAGARKAAGPLLDRMLDRHLLAATPGGAALEPGHRALATAWPQLARWLDETHDERRLAAELEQAARRWQQRGRRDTETWRGGALADVVRKVETWSLAPPAAARELLAASARRERRLRRRWRWLSGGVAAAHGALAIALAVVWPGALRADRDRPRALELEAPVPTSPLGRA